MKKTFFLSIFLLVFCICNMYSQNASDLDKINNFLDNWHKAAAIANTSTYFDSLTEDAIFIGTDPTENWNKIEFLAFAKPYFDKGKAWNFTPLNRHVYFSKDSQLAWFDELLDTEMKICRGSGVVIKIGSEWKIKHYVLSMTIPNENTKAVLKIKGPIEDGLILKLKAK